MLMTALDATASTGGSLVRRRDDDGYLMMELIKIDDRETMLYSPEDAGYTSGAAQ